MIILGIDPGYGRVGWGVVKKERNDIVHIAHGCIETKAKSNFPDRLLCIHEIIEKIIKKFQPQHAGIETLFFKKNVTTGLQVAHARGVILLQLHKAGIGTHDIAPVEVKKAITGYGSADKQQMQKMIKLQLRLKDIPKPDDAADALGIAYASAVLLRI